MRWSRWIGITAVALVAMGGSAGSAQTTQPAPAAAASGTTGTIEVRAASAMSAGDYNAALPLLKKMAIIYSGEPMRLAAIKEQIRVCEKNIAAGVTGPDPSLPPEVVTAPDKRTKHTRPEDGKALDLTIKELGNFEYDADKGGNIPKDVSDLTGTTIRLRGFMIPMDQAEAISKFALVPSLFACCFGQPPQLQHTIVVDCPKGKAVSYYPEEIIVEGKLTVDEKREDGFIISVFEIRADSVKPAPR